LGIFAGSDTFEVTLCEVDAFVDAVIVVNTAQDLGFVATAGTGIDSDPVAFAGTLCDVVGVSVIAVLDKLGQSIAIADVVGSSAGVFLSLLAIDIALLAN
jgi:hypothetical protein